MNKKFDYAVLEREYITGDMSLRELAKQHGIANHSVVVVRARNDEWARKREEYRDKASDRAVTYMADQEGFRRAQEMRVRDNAIEAIDEAISLMRDQMKQTRLVMRNGEYVEEPLIVMRAQDISLLIDRLNVLFGRPANITEERNLGIAVTGGLTPEALKGIVEATRGLADTGGAALSPFPRADRPREN